MQLTATWLPADFPEADAPNLHIVKTQGDYLITAAGNAVYDAISSWWCKPLGHSHPLVIEAIQRQLSHYEHHMPAQAWNSTVEQLSQRLIAIFNHMDKVMYASDGSSAVEMAMKLSYETRVLNGQPQRSKFIALRGAYHGETMFTLSVCGLPSYSQKYANLLQPNYFIENITYVTGPHDPLWSNSNFALKTWDDFFAQHAATTTALILEPLVQGAAGMKIISRDFLAQLMQLARKHDLHIIADEIMVGLGRLGCYSPSKEIIGIEPDLVCFAKNLTAGSIPMSAVVISKSISEVFRYYRQRFDHSHTHSCNSLAAAVANSYLDHLASSNILSQVQLCQAKLQAWCQQFQTAYSFIRTSRTLGAIIAFELELTPTQQQQVFELGLKQHLFMRMIGNVIYLLPPLHQLDENLDFLERSLDQLFSQLLT